MLNAEWVDELSDEQLRRVRELLLDVRDTDGRPEVTEDGPLPPELRGGLQLLAGDPDEHGAGLAGYAHLDTAGDAFGRQVAELVVRPSLRRRGLGTALTETLLERVDTPLRIWSHGDHPGAARIAERLGLARVRELLRMRLEFATAPELPPLRAPDGVSIRTFRPGVDEQAMIDVNARAFAWHPEQGTLSVDELRGTEREGWFDPDGFFLAVDAQDRVLGFHWTKVHPTGEGEVYVVGVDPDAQGGGLGKVLTLAGLHYLREIGRTEVILYVEGDNGPAVSVYRKLGFERASTDVQYAGP